MKHILSIFSLLVLLVSNTETSAQKITIRPIDIFQGANEINPYVADSVLYFSSNAKTSFFVNYLDENDDQLYRIFYVNLRDKLPKGTAHVYLDYHNEPVNQVHMCFDNEKRPVVTQNNQTIKNSMGNALSIYRFNNSEDMDPKTFIPQYGKFNIAYASVSQDGNMLIFASDEVDESSLGKNDLYYCLKKNGRWSAPRNMGAVVNTAGNEIAPYIHPSGKIFFSSNGRQDSRKLDVYYTFVVDAEKGRFAEPVRFDLVVNSLADDYGFYYSDNEEWGYITSNRKGDDKLYFFQHEFPKLGEGVEMEEENYCFTFFEETAAQYDTTEFDLKWKFIGGNEPEKTVMGVEVDHCFPGPGEYFAQLSVVDKSTKEEMFNIAEYPISLEKPSQLNILVPEKIQAGVPVVFDVDPSQVTEFKPVTFYWDFGTAGRCKGKRATVTFKKKGEYKVKCGTINEDDDTEILCYWTTVTVM